MTFFATKSRITGNFKNVPGFNIPENPQDRFPWYGQGRTINITYTWGSSEADLDTRTYLIAPFGSVGGVMGWNYASGVSGIATWSGDDTGYGGSEYVTIYLDPLVLLTGYIETSEYVNSPSDLWLDIHMGAYFYGRYVDPDGDEGPLPPEPRDPSRNATFNYTIQTFSQTSSFSQTATHREFVGIGINEFATYRIDLLTGFII